MKILNITEAAAYVRLHPNTIRNLLKKKMLPGAKVGARWRIYETDLEDWIRDQYTNSARVQPDEKEDQCLSTPAQGFTMSSSKAQTARRLDDLLKLGKGKKPKSSTTV